MAKTKKKRVAKKARSERELSAQHVYYEPKTAAELGINCAVCGNQDKQRTDRKNQESCINCAVCGNQAEWFDNERAKKDQGTYLFGPKH
jgi:Zn ribbon nucleic-acid-binding protein